ncbi:MAG: hypothetical protein AAGC95_12970 [Pseudomonadota bacterium]
MEVSPLLIATTSFTVIVFSLAIGLDTTWRAAEALIRNPRAVLVGVIGQYIILPAIGVAVVIGLSLPVEIGFGLLILASAPGGTLSNALVYLMRGDTMLSVILTSISSLASPLSMATILTLTTALTYGQTDTIVAPFLQTFLTLIVLVFIPLLAGYGLKAIWKNAHIVLKPWLDRSGGLGLVITVTMIVWINIDLLLKNLMASLPAAALLIFSAGFIAWLLTRTAGLGRKQTTAILFEVGLQNIALATIVAVQVLQNPQLAVFPVVYGCVSLVAFLPATFYMRAQGDRASKRINKENQHV